MCSIAIKKMMLKSRIKQKQKTINHKTNHYLLLGKIFIYLNCK